MKNVIFSIVLALSFFSNLPKFLIAQQVIENKNKPFNFGASYTGDNVNNLSGGIKAGSAYLGLANIRLNFDTEKAKIWKGGSFFLNAANTHGAMPSADLFGDMQVASNIEAGNHTFIQELFYSQTLKQMEFILGLQDLNVEFANSENAAVFLNSSFGILPLISGNIAAPIFPLTTLGFTAKWNTTDKAFWLNAIYDGSPTDFDYNPYNLNWQYNSNDGILFVSEYQYNAVISKLSGIYKVGFYSHNHYIGKTFNNTIPDSLKTSTYGVYTYADQNIWQENNKGLGMFLQSGYSPCKGITNNYYLGMGLNFKGAFNQKGLDILALALAYEHFTNHLKSETVIEISYRYQITANIFLQPDIQYIINPAGTGENLDNALAGIFRLGLNF